MKAYTISHYGNPQQVLHLVELPRPEPGPNDVLIKVKATTVNDYDWSLTSGKPLAYRAFFGLLKPRKKLQVPGMEVAGIVEATGEEVKRFKVGDAVYGDTSDHEFGSYAEYMRVHENALTLKPKNMSFAEAASIPHAAMLAWQGLFELGNLANGQDVLINGGGGGVGFFAVQMARYQKANRIVGVDTGKKLKLMKDIGYDRVIDYKKDDFTRLGETYDLILDCRTNRYASSYMRALKPEGNYITVGGKSGKLISILMTSPIRNLLTKKRLKMLALKPNKDLNSLNNLFTSGNLKCVMDGPYPFEKIPEAIKRFGDGLHHGKIVIEVN